MIIIPDIHGRKFWKSAVKGHEEDDIVFLGDYLDCYTDDEDTDNPLDNLKEIIEFKKEHKDNVILLLGNHDVHYFIPNVIKSTRFSYWNEKEYYKLFTENYDLFQLCYEKEINGKRFLFSHAGILTDWFIFRSNGITINNICDYLNNAYLVKDNHLGFLLSALSKIRGGLDIAGSCIWADVKEHLLETEPHIDAYQVFGHTQLTEYPIITDRFACLDVRRAFVISTVFGTGEQTLITEQDGTPAIKYEELKSKFNGK